jgi:hypothetical protein
LEISGLDKNFASVPRLTQIAQTRSSAAEYRHLTTGLSMQGSPAIWPSIGRPCFSQAFRSQREVIAAMSCKMQAVSVGQLIRGSDALPADLGARF